MKKLKLAIFAVQAKSVDNFFPLPKKAIMGRALGADRHPPATPALSKPFNHVDRQHHEKLSQPFIQSWCQKVVGGHLSLLDELIKFPEGKCTHLR